MRYFQCGVCEKVWSEKELIHAKTWSRWTVTCADHECGGVVPVEAGVTRVGGEGSDRQIASMKKSFRQRFVKKEMDDVRHKHPEAFNDSIRGAEVGRIKKKLGQ